MNGWLALGIVAGASVIMKVLKKKGIVPEQSGETSQGTAPVTTYSQSGNYQVRLNDAGRELVKAIKVYREFTGVGLKEAKDMIDSAPCIVLKTEDYQNARSLADQFSAIGASVTIVGDDNCDPMYSENYSQGQVYKVYLHDDGGEKVKAIKYYRDHTGEGLKESKDKIDSAPCTMMVTTDYQKAKRMVDDFRAFGANVSIIEE